MRFVLFWLLLVSACGKNSTYSVKGASPVVVGDLDLAKNRNAALGLPQSLADDVLISRDEYVLSYNTKARVLSWVAWKVEGNDLGKVGRTEAFDVDPDLKTLGVQAVEASEYKGSCLDRGHQTPSADRTATEEKNKKTFFMSNMLPQTAYLNRGIWARIEHWTREVVRQGKSVYVFAGPIGGRYKIGPQRDIVVPEANWKVVLDEEQKVLLSVIIPNLTSTGTDPIDDQSQACDDSQHFDPSRNLKKGWHDYVVPLGEIEAEAKINLETFRQ